MSNPLNLFEKARFVYRAWRYRWCVEPAEVRFVRRQLRPGQIGVDIGGHKGAFTYWMQRSVGRSGRVFTFEPQPELATYLRAATKALCLSHVEIVGSALSSKPGARQLFRPTNRPSPGATLRPVAAGQACSIPVRLETLDEYFADRPERPIDLIKCDAEGHELEIFRGAQTILENDRPVLLFECEQRHHGSDPIAEVFRYLNLCEYSGAFFQRGKLKPLHEFDPDSNRPREPGYVNNFVFVPKPQRAVCGDRSEWGRARRTG